MLELACFTASSALTAARAGASRIELCASYTSGGVTPLLSTLHSIRDELQRSSPSTATIPGAPTAEHGQIPIYIMIRPRGGDFSYTPTEFEAMKSSIDGFQAIGDGAVQGFVFGILTADARVDGPRCRELVELAAPLPCTFHRAVDGVADEDLEGAVQTIVECGFESVLTSGGAGSAREGVERVAGLQKKYGERITLILGGGVRSSNVVGLKREAGVRWVHSAAITGPGEEVDEAEARRMVALLQHV
ncbi:uncharacterized protein EKO05_0000455 [Ascochyta rabiei]|uniref:Copper homeostasis protein cutC homolog n=1 Tax=Didymella rabiei TaxID=5454 RepID=A0A163J5H5_DIDRA|nr:uncharacterized protein EKO05_0000455 [Ascochyta rabiei]KZM26156.1 copper ion binding [Ascochyta rabiei]UPX09772.1 hypothetical protein EKO05_0000455 [Ascochyta rabiei]